MGGVTGFLMPLLEMPPDHARGVPAERGIIMVLVSLYRRLGCGDMNQISDLNINLNTKQ